MKKIAALAALCACVTLLNACKTDTASAPSDPAESQSAPASFSEEQPAADIPEDEAPYTLGGELTPSMKALSRYNVGNRARLKAVMNSLAAGEEVTVAYIGGSITQGSTAGNDLCYARLTTNRLGELFPEAKINYVNAGIGATGSYIGVHRADSDVLKHNPDLVFVDFSVNDTSDRAALNKEAYESLLLKLWNAESKPAVVTIAMTQDNGTSLQELHGEIAKKLGIPMISYKDAVLSVIKRGDIAWKDISDDNIHPNVTGHALLTDIIMDNLESVISDEITDEEPALPTEAKYTNARFVYADNTEPTSLGGFMVHSTGIGGFANSWVAKNSEGSFTESDALELEVPAKNIGIVYGKLTGKYTKADVYIDGEYRATLDGNFSGGWGSYAEFAEIASFDEESTHTVKIVPQATEGAAVFYVCRIAVS